MEVMAFGVLGGMVKIAELIKGLRVLRMRFDIGFERVNMACHFIF
jgi:hypothetical protein